MGSSKWSSKEYSFEDLYPASQYDFILQLKFDATDEQIKAYKRASMRGGHPTINKVKADGVQPTINIPVRLELTKKAGVV